MPSQKLACLYLSSPFHIFEIYISGLLNHLQISPIDSPNRTHYPGLVRNAYEGFTTMLENQTENTTPTGQDAPAELPKKKGGPRTPEGRRRSSLNATRHQLTSKVYIATPEESEAYNAHIGAYMEALAPIGVLETELAALIAADRWRCKRAIMVENSIFAQGYLDHAEAIDVDNSQVAEALAEAKTWAAQANSLSLLTTYEGRITRRADRNMAQLTEMQTRRREAYAQAQREAIHLVQLSEAAGEVYEPGDDFEPAAAHGQFVYSAPEIARVRDRRERLDLGCEVVNHPDRFKKVA
jgi:hypothetical protein